MHTEPPLVVQYEKQYELNPQMDRTRTDTDRHAHTYTHIHTHTHIHTLKSPGMKVEQRTEEE